MFSRDCVILTAHLFTWLSPIIMIFCFLFPGSSFVLTKDLLLLTVPTLSGPAIGLLRFCSTSYWTTLLGIHWQYLVLLTPWSRFLLEKLTVNFAASQEIHRIYGTRKFLTIPTSARHLSLFWANSIQSPQPPPTSWRSSLKKNLRLRDTSSRNTPPPRRSEWGSSLCPECFVSRGSISHV
jgi:hypothetical protein